MNIGVSASNTNWSCELGINNILFLNGCERSIELRLFNLDPQVNGLLIKVPIDTVHVPQVISFNIFLCLNNNIRLSLSKNFSDIFSIILLVKHSKFNPSGEVARSDFDTSSEIISVVLSPADHCKHEVGLSQILALEALRNLVHNWANDEVKQDV